MAELADQGRDIQVTVLQIRVSIFSKGFVCGFKTHLQARPPELQMLS